MSTHDKKLHVFIKYVEIGNIKKKKKYINYKLFCNHIDSITLSSMNYNSSGKKGEIKDKIYVYRNRYLNKKKIIYSEKIKCFIQQEIEMFLKIIKI